MSTYELIVAALLAVNTVLLIVVAIRHLRTPKSAAATAVRPLADPELSPEERAQH